ncbi:hypothetical protein [Niallia taxi]|uniref:Uncharacterized protein n=1 Tax=Niallia taxi TaxID=2499688 RepID=A0A3S2X4T8_9BACI|nr:hypothetical protein [Niallia taxi]RVT56435.1 hypothetical protein EM808_27490 [Niallia taxi]
MQKGMHDTFVFPMDCQAHIMRWNDKEKLKIFEYEGKRILSGIPSGSNSFYNPFEFDNLIPEFIQMIEKILNGANLEKNIKEWLLKWGPLYGDMERDTVEIFWDECAKFYKLWNFYKAIANKEKGTVLKNIEIEKKTDTNYKITFFPEDSLFQPAQWFTDLAEMKKSIPYIGMDREEFDYKKILPMKLDKERDEFEQIQEHCMFFLFTQIEDFLKGANLTWGSMSHEKKENQSIFKIRPVLQTEYLIDTIYLQFYILFSENEKKICPVCNTPFIPQRKDKKYCSNTCKLTAKSQRYRARKTS